MSGNAVGQVKATFLAALASVGVVLSAGAAQAADRFHSVLLSGPAEPVSVPMIIVGLEKASPRKVGHIATDLNPKKGCVASDRCLHLSRGKGPGLEGGASLIEQRLNDDPLFVSHIVDLQPAGEIATIYTAYNPPDDKGRLRLKTEPLVERSWSALEEDLGGAIKRRIDEICKTQCPTHIVLMSTGWRTPQRASIGHYQAWASGIEHELRLKGTNFVPIYIGLTWPSDWVLEYPSFINKAHDADEAGYIWGSILLNRVLAPVAEARNLQIVLIGHSFGARLLTGAVAGHPFVSDVDCRQVGKRTLMIGYQAAFSTGRFAGLGIEGAPYLKLPSCGSRFAFTASKHDEGVRWAPMEQFSQATGYMGGAQGLEMIKASPTVYELATADAHGNLSQLWSAAEPRRVLMIESSQGVECHNDVYDQFATRIGANLIANDPKGRADLLDRNEICGGR